MNFSMGGTPLVILPGLLCDSGMFAAQIAAFDAQIIDGCYDGAYRIEAMADHALARMPARCALLGHSMGARVALEIWRRAPARIAGLALVDTGVHALRDAEAAQRCRLRDLGRERGSEALVDAWLPPMIGAAHRHDPALVAQLRAMCVAAGSAVFDAQTHAMLHRPDAREVLPTITCPTFVIVGRDDMWSPVSQHEDIAALIPGASLRVVENAGHMLPAEEPAAFNAVLQEWLDYAGHEQESLEINTEPS